MHNIQTQAPYDFVIIEGMQTIVRGMVVPACELTVPVGYTYWFLRSCGQKRAEKA